MWLWERNQRIYLDYASATPVVPEALRAMREAEKLIGNPGAIHEEGVEAKKCLEEARAVIAHELGCKPREILLTSGLTEANNLAVLGVARFLERAGRIQGTHWVVSAIEHDAVLESFSEIERLGGEVRHIEPNTAGVITKEGVLDAIQPNTILVSIGWANNEIGIVQPLREIARAIKEKNADILLHSDAGQAPLYISPQVHTLGVDLLSLGSNKLYGPHGIGALYISNRVAAASLVVGGKQERGLRAGTENVALAAGFAASFKKVAHERDREKLRLKNLRDELMRLIVAKVPDVIVNGDIERVLPHMLNVSIPHIKSEYVTLSLDQAGIAVSTKSACREGENDFSHVVRTLGGDAWRAKNTLRFSLGHETRESDIPRVAKELITILSRGNMC
jgi:cysteine desulfurase